jgi:hypothetical protein
MSKDGRIELLVKIVLSEARSGNLLPLIARFEGGRLTDPEREFIIDFLERHQDKRRAKAELHPIEQDLIRGRVEDLIAGDDKKKGVKTEAAVAQVMRERGCSRSKVFEAIKESKERESKRRESK